MNKKTGARHNASIEFSCLSVIFHLVASFNLAFNILLGDVWKTHNIIILAFELTAAVYFNYKKLSVLGKSLLKEHIGRFVRETLYTLFEIGFICLCTKPGVINPIIIAVAVVMGVAPVISSAIRLNFDAEVPVKTAQGELTKRIVFFLMWVAMLAGAVVWRI